jgi:hypothetical protein
MPDQPLPTPLSTFAPFDPAKAQPVPSRRPQCRALTVDGHRCNNHVLGGLHLCFSHYRNRRPALPEPHKISIPLLENHAAIQLVATQIVQAVLSHTIDPLHARVALRALRIAAMTLPKPVAPPADPAGSAFDDTVCRIGRDHEDFISADGDLAAPELNPSCSVAESADAARTLLDTLEPASHCHDEDVADDRPALDPTHDFERCICHACAGYRRWMEEVRERDRTVGAAG